MRVHWIGGPLLQKFEHSSSDRFPTHVEGTHPPLQNVAITNRHELSLLRP